MSWTSRDLTLLLSIGSLPMGCFKDEGQGSGGTTPGTEGDGTTGTGATGGTGGMSETGAPVTSGSSSGTGGDETGAPVTDEQCLAYASRIVECLPQYAKGEAYYATYCVLSKQRGMMFDGPACVAALEAAFVCVSNADCGTFGHEPGPCPDAWAAVDSACPVLYGGDDESTGDVPETGTGGGSTGGGTTMG